MREFKAETQVLPEKVYFVLEGVFEAADAFDPIGLPNKEKYHRLNENEFRAEVANLFKELESVTN